MSLDKVYRLFCDGFTLSYRSTIPRPSGCVAFSADSPSSKDARAAAVKDGWKRRDLTTKYVNTDYPHANTEKVDLCPKCAVAYDGVTEVSVDVGKLDLARAAS